MKNARKIVPCGTSKVGAVEAAFRRLEAEVLERHRGELEHLRLLRKSLALPALWKRATDG